MSRKHRKFAENLDNWYDLDNLIGDLARLPKYPGGYDYEAISNW